MRRPALACRSQWTAKADTTRNVARNTGVTKDDKKRWHLVEDNTDFDELFFGQREYWFCSDIQDRSALPQYLNTSPGDRRYRSVIAWPITARTGTSVTNSLTRGYDVAAFLCLDADFPNAFDEMTDVPMGLLVAQALGRAFEAHYASFPNTNTKNTNEPLNGEKSA